MKVKRIIVSLMAVLLSVSLLGYNVSAQEVSNTAGYKYGTAVASNRKTFAAYTRSPHASEAVTVQSVGKYSTAVGNVTKTYNASKDPSLGGAYIQHQATPTGANWISVTSTHRYNGNYLGTTSS